MNRIDNNTLDLLSKFNKTATLDGTSNCNESTNQNNVVIDKRYLIVEKLSNVFGKNFEKIKLGNEDYNANTNDHVASHSDSYHDTYHDQKTRGERKNSNVSNSRSSNSRVSYYSAIDSKTNNKVLIAISTKNNSRDESVLKRLSCLYSDNLLNVVDYGTKYNYQYIVYQYIDSNTKTLHDYLSSGKLFTIEQLRKHIIRDINNALNVLHNANLSFNKMSLDSILASSDGTRAMLIDTDLCQSSKIQNQNEVNDYSLDAIFKESPYYHKDEKELHDSLIQTDYYLFGTIIYQLVTGEEFLQDKTSFDYINSSIPKDILCLIEGLTYKAPTLTAVSTTGSTNDSRCGANCNHSWGYTEVENWLNGITMLVPGHDNLYYMALKNGEHFNGLVTCGNFVFGNQLVGLGLSSGLNESQASAKPTKAFSYRFMNNKYNSLESLVRAMLKYKDDGIKEVRRSLLSNYLKDIDTDLWKICCDGELDLKSCGRNDNDKYFLRTMYWLAPTVTQIYWNGNEHNNVSELLRYTLDVMEKTLTKQSYLMGDDTNDFDDIFTFVDSYYEYAKVSEEEKNKYYEAMTQYKKLSCPHCSLYNKYNQNRWYIKCLHVYYLLGNEPSYVSDRHRFGTLHEFFDYIKGLYNNDIEEYKNLIYRDYDNFKVLQALFKKIITEEELEYLNERYHGLMLLKSGTFKDFDDFTEYYKKLKSLNDSSLEHFIAKNRIEIERYCSEYPSTIEKLQQLGYKPLLSVKCSPDYSLNDDDDYSNESSHEVITFGNYWQNSSTTKEPIEWYVIRDYSLYCIFLVSKRALSMQQFNDTNTKSDWKNCTLRKWLNEEFINDAFTTEEQELLLTIKVQSPSLRGGDDTNNTEDKVSLSWKDSKLCYVSPDNDTPCLATKYAVNDFTREPGPTHFWTFQMINSCSKIVVDENGKFDENTKSIAHTEYRGVRPIICIKKSNLKRN